MRRSPFGTRTANDEAVQSVVDDSGSAGPDRESYTGRLVGGLRDGRGACAWKATAASSPMLYDGEWREDKRDGWGTWRSGVGAGASSPCFEGLWRDDSWSRGTWRQDGVDEWHGDWVCNSEKQAYEMQGWGVQRRKKAGGERGGGDCGTAAMVTVYEGEWSGNKWHGRGTWISPANGDMYHGQFVQGRRCGTGRMLFGAGGDTGGGGSYVGGWEDDKFHGRGVRIWENGDRYEGDWVMGKENGAGKKVWACSGTLFEGSWEMGAIKSGTIRWVNGDEFSGTFTDRGVGQGTAAFRSSGTRIEGTLTNGVFQGREIGISQQMGCSGDQQIVGKLKEQIHSLEHTLQHIQRGVWTNTVPQERDGLRSHKGTPATQCAMKKLSITLESHNITFHDSVCSLCPLDKVVKMEVQKRFGLDENHQTVSASLTGNSGQNVELEGTSLSLLPVGVAIEAKVSLRPVMTIRDTDLQVTGHLGGGSYGTVERCIHTPSKREVAVKKIHEIIREPYVEKFMREAEIVSGLRNPNIVRCIGTAITGSGHLMIVSEVLCCSLRQLLEKKQLMFNEAVAVALNVSKGMDSLHRQKIMHRDLSSNNILFDSNGTPKICDFGVSCEMSQQVLGTSTKGPGTAVYMSPQMFTEHYSIKGDMWSFGILMTEILNGGLVDSTFAALPLHQQAKFMTDQKTLLPQPDVDEVKRLCGESTEQEIAPCLSRRKASLEVVEGLMHSTIDSQLRTAADLMLLVVQSCLSILEENRVPFTVIVKFLFGCCTAITSTTGVQVTDDQVNDCITQWLSALIPSIHLASSH
ncbi:Dual specificity mitogen-activated protein kinase kinase 6 [Pelomyxa schiedti]|nr:Dual specificity mitogen-activated protein kinase kinase 6 [Pelomyxa schiedti]